jgi:hypothetical protein
MKKVLLHLIILTGMAFPALAQNTYQYDMKPDMPVTKEVALEGIQTADELKIALKIEWKTSDDRLHLTFDRKTVNENDVYLLFFPLLSEKKALGDVADCKLQKKSIYSKTLNVKSGKMGYFLTAENLIIADRFNCYRSLANNNEEEFAFEMKNIEEDFTIELTDLYVAKTQKKSFFSKKDKKLLFKVKPITIQMIPEKKAVKPDLCGMAGVVVPYVQAQHTVLNTYIGELKDAKQKQNCTVFGLLMDKIRRTFVELNDKCERFTDCEQIAEALKIYNKDVESAMEEECKAAPVQRTQTAASCSMSENELTAINNMLRNLQMKINVKNKDGASTAEEYKDFQAIKNAVTPKLTPECRRAHKGLTDAYTSYCTVIQGLF